MRSSKYHDYRVLKIALFILVVLALFIYLKFIEAPHEHTPAGSWEVVENAKCTENGSKIKVCTECNEIVDTQTIPATGHNPGMAVRENEKAATCTMGGSYDVVVYCRNCNMELSRETVQVEKLDHNPAKAVKGNIIDSTHVKAGSYDMITKCKDCGDVLETTTHPIEPKGHTYSEWKLEYIAEIDEFVLGAKCVADNCKEEGNVITFTKENGLIVTLNGASANCVEKIYTASITFEGETISLQYEAETDPHMYDDESGNGYVSADEYAMYDEVYGVYYLVDTPGIRVATNPDQGLTIDNVWDENGFAAGAFYCEVCETWYEVYVYSAAHDTRINNSEN